jgi:hypothetical protein
MLRWLIGILAVGSLAVSAGGQTTQPSPDGWNKTVAAFAGAVQDADPDTARGLLADACDIHTFQSDRSTGVTKLIDFAGGQALLGSHAYAMPTVSLATDVANDVARSEDVPPDAKKDLTIDDLAVQARANATATRWLTSTLKAQDGTLVGVVELWNTNASASDNPPHPLFILVTGAVSDAGVYTISKIVYGDPIQN